MSTAGSPRPSATSIVARRPSKDEITGWQDRQHSPHDDAVGRGGGLTASRPSGTSSSARPSPRRRPPLRDDLSPWWWTGAEEVLVGSARGDDVERDLCVRRVERRRRRCNDLDRLAQFGDVSRLYDADPGPSRRRPCSYRSDDGTISPSDTEEGDERTPKQKEIGALFAGQTRRHLIDLTAPSAAGTYYYGACVSGNASLESDGTNNCSESVQVVVSD